MIVRISSVWAHFVVAMWVRLMWHWDHMVVYHREALKLFLTVHHIHLVWLVRQIIEWSVFVRHRWWRLEFVAMLRIVIRLLLTIGLPLVVELSWVMHVALRRWSMLLATILWHLNFVTVRELVHYILFILNYNFNFNLLIIRDLHNYVIFIIA